MTELEYIANLNDLSGIETVIYEDAEVVPDELLRSAQRAQRDSIKANLPSDEWNRADEITRIDDFETYKDRRVHPQRQVGKDD